MEKGGTTGDERLAGRAAVPTISPAGEAWTRDGAGYTGRLAGSFDLGLRQNTCRLTDAQDRFAGIPTWPAPGICGRWSTLPRPHGRGVDAAARRPASAATLARFASAAHTVAEVVLRSGTTAVLPAGDGSPGGVLFAARSPASANLRRRRKPREVSGDALWSSTCAVATTWRIGPFRRRLVAARFFAVRSEVSGMAG
jgi:hypothetical protein